MFFKVAGTNPKFTCLGVSAHSAVCTIPFRGAKNSLSYSRVDKRRLYACLLAFILTMWLYMQVDCYSTIPVFSRFCFSFSCDVHCICRVSISRLPDNRTPKPQVKLLVDSESERLRQPCALAAHVTVAHGSSSTTTSTFPLHRQCLSADDLLASATPHGTHSQLLQVIPHPHPKLYRIHTAYTITL